MNDLASWPRDSCVWDWIKMQNDYWSFVGGARKAGMFFAFILNKNKNKTMGFYFIRPPLFIHFIHTSLLHFTHALTLVHFIFYMHHVIHIHTQLFIFLKAGDPVKLENWHFQPLYCLLMLSFNPSTLSWDSLMCLVIDYWFISSIRLMMVQKFQRLRFLGDQDWDMHGQLSRNEHEITQKICDRLIYIHLKILIIVLSIKYKSSSSF